MRLELRLEVGYTDRELVVAQDLGSRGEVRLDERSKGRVSWVGWDRKG